MQIVIKESMRIIYSVRLQNPLDDETYNENNLFHQTRFYMNICLYQLGNE